MSDQAQTSSITSVTEEEDSPVDWEFDNTESNSSAVTSTPVDYSSTDDKLTPGLGSISISKAVDNQSGHDFPTQLNDHTEMRPPAVPSFPYGSNPLSLPRSKNKKLGNSSKRPHCSNSYIESTSDGELSESVVSVESNDYEDETLTKPKTKAEMLDPSNRNNNSKTDSNLPFSQTYDSEGQYHDSLDQRPFHPDMTSDSWYQAQCFDSYWRHYHFVMDWYKQHLVTVQKLSQMNWSAFGGEGAQGNSSARAHKNSRSARKTRASKRARSRRLRKEHQRASKLSKASSSANVETMESESSEEEVEMEMTDEMVKFFTASLKHRMERDNQKKDEENIEEENHVNIEQVVVGHQAPSISAPTEQPGVRRTSELKILYGSNAPMIHGMETALQLNFDRFTDKCQPNLWPNMPLKICFG